MADYQHDLDRLFDQIDDAAWTAEKREAIAAKVAEAKDAGVKRSLIEESVTGAKRQYALSKRVDPRGLLLRKISCVEDQVIWRLQNDIDNARRRAKKGRR
jgi:hypothetical protein